MKLLEINQSKPEDLERIEKARNNLLDCILYLNPDYEVNWHHKLIAEYLDKFVNNEILKLAIFMPPQHGKSFLASQYLPSYLFAKNPNERILACSYTDDLATGFSRDVQRIMDLNEYKLLFPKTFLNSKNVVKDSLANWIRTSNHFEIVGHKGFYRCTGLNGSITGYPANTIIIDDPIKGQLEANSLTIRNSVWYNFTGSIYTRKSSANTKMILIQTRWHEDDLAGRLFNIEGELNKWTVLSFPAICEEPKHSEDPRKIGEALWDKKTDDDHSKPLSFLQEQRIVLGTKMFTSLYQQKPQPDSGSLFKRKDFCYYEIKGNVYKLLGDGEPQLIHLSDMTIFTTMDLAMKTGTQNDFTVISVFGLTRQNDIVLLDMLRVKVEGAEHINLVWQIHHKWKPNEHNIESVQYQITLVQNALKQGLPARELKTKGSKEVRAFTIAAKFEGHKVYMPRDADYLADIESELLHFPFGTHDDIVDTFAYAGIRATELSGFFLPQLKKLNGDVEPLGTRFKMNKQLQNY